MSSNARGYCLIFANSNFAHMPSLIGYSTDVSRLGDLFTQLYFKVRVYTNCSAQLMKEKVQKYSKLGPGEDCRVPPNAFVCIVLTHGTEHKLYGSGYNHLLREADGKTIPPQPDQEIGIEELLNLVNNEHCEMLRKKPKIFIIQACRGGKKTYPILSIVPIYTLIILFHMYSFC
jgi:hypothetical protein